MSSARASLRRPLVQALLGVAAVLLLAGAGFAPTPPQGSIVLANRSLYVIGADGRGLRQLTHPGGLFDSNPVWSPDGRWIAFTRNYTGTLDSEWREVFIVRSNGTGLRKLTHFGLQIVAPKNLTWSRQGALAFESGTDTRACGAACVWVARAPSWRPQMVIRQAYSPSWAPDGKQIVYVTDKQPDTGQAIHVFDLRTHRDIDLSSKRPADKFASEMDPAWSPAGNEIAFARFPVPAGSGADWVMDTVGHHRRLLSASGNGGDLAWSADGKTIALDTGSGPSEQVWAVPVVGGGPPVQVGMGGLPSWSPDDAQLAFIDAGDQVEVVNRDGTGLHELAAGSQASWDPKG